MNKVINFVHLYSQSDKLIGHLIASSEGISAFEQKAVKDEVATVLAKYRRMVPLSSVQTARSSNDPNEIHDSLKEFKIFLHLKLNNMNLTPPQAMELAAWSKDCDNVKASACTYVAGRGGDFDDDRLKKLVINGRKLIKKGDVYLKEPNWRKMATEIKRDVIKMKEDLKDHIKYLEGKAKPHNPSLSLESNKPEPLVLQLSGSSSVNATGIESSQKPLEDLQYHRVTRTCTAGKLSLSQRKKASQAAKKK